MMPSGFCNDSLDKETDRASWIARKVGKPRMAIQIRLQRLTICAKGVRSLSMTPC
jgi:hypothetical protein